MYDSSTQTNRLFLQRHFGAFIGGSFDFSPVSDLGIFAFGGVASHKLYWLRPSGLTRLSYPLADIGSPAWSPDGKTIALDALEATAGPIEPGRPIKPWSLYLLDVHSMKLHKLTGGLEDHMQPQWSPDGRWLAVTTSPQGQPHGVWVISAVDGSIHLVARGDEYGWKVWLPDGRLVVEVGQNSSIKSRRHGLEILTLRLPVHR